MVAFFSDGDHLALLFDPLLRAAEIHGFKRRCMR